MPPDTLRGVAAYCPPADSPPAAHKTAANMFRKNAMKTSVQGSLMENHFENNRTNDCCRSGAHRRLLLKAGVAALAGALLVGCSGGGNTPEGVAKEFMTAVSKGDADTALGLLVVPESAEEKELVLGKMRSMIVGAKKQTDAKGGLERIEVISSEIASNNPDRAHVELRLYFKKGQETDNVRLTRIKGKWLVDPL